MDHTYRYGTARLVEVLRLHGRMTVWSLQVTTGMHSDSIQRALEPAIANGDVTVRLVPRPSGRGAPQRYYEWAGGDAAASPQSKTRCRPCLCCRREFVSAGPHNRMCSACRQLNVSPYAI